MDDIMELSDQTRRQLEALEQVTGQNQGEIMQIAVDSYLSKVGKQLVMQQLNNSINDEDMEELEPEDE